MAALNTERDTKRRTGDLINLEVAAGATIFKGAAVAVDADGRAVPAGASGAVLVVGRAEDTADNGEGAAGALNVDVRLGVFLYDNSGVTAANIGKTASFTDDQTAAASGGTPGGRVLALDREGVWIDLRRVEKQ